MTQCAGCTVSIAASALDDIQPTTMSVLQLRRTLRALGVPTAGLRPVLASRLQQAIDDGSVAILASRLKAKEPVSQVCVLELTKGKKEAKIRALQNSDIPLNLSTEDANIDRTSTTSTRSDYYPTKSPHYNDLREFSEVRTSHNSSLSSESDVKTYASDNLKQVPPMHRPHDRSLFSSSSMPKLEIVTRPPSIPRTHLQPSPTPKSMKNTPTASSVSKNLNPDSISINTSATSGSKTPGTLGSCTPKNLKISSIKNLNLRPAQVSAVPYTPGSFRATAMMSPQTKLPPSSRDPSTSKTVDQWRNSPSPNSSIVSSNATNPPSPTLYPSDALERKRREIQLRYAGMRKGQISTSSTATSPTGSINMRIVQTSSNATTPSSKGASPMSSFAIHNNPANSESSTHVPRPSPPLPVGGTSSVVLTDSGGEGEDRESYDNYEVDADDVPHRMDATGDFTSSSEGEDEVERVVEANENYEKSKSPASSALEDEEGDHDCKSGIPAWARGAKLAAALERQFNEKNPVNPDTIFAEFFTCNLQHIFDTKKKRYVTRGSSGNWLQDRLTLPERLAYQKAMGYVPTNSGKRSVGNSR